MSEPNKVYEQLERFSYYKKNLEIFLEDGHEETCLMGEMKTEIMSNSKRMDIIDELNRLKSAISILNSVL